MTGGLFIWAWIPGFLDISWTFHGHVGKDTVFLDLITTAGLWYQRAYVGLSQQIHVTIGDATGFSRSARLLIGMPEGARLATPRYTLHDSSSWPPCTAWRLETGGNRHRFFCASSCRLPLRTCLEYSAVRLLWHADLRASFFIWRSGLPFHWFCAWSFTASLCLYGATFFFSLMTRPLCLTLIISWFNDHISLLPRLYFSGTKLHRRSLVQI